MRTMINRMETAISLAAFCLVTTSYAASPYTWSGGGANVFWNNTTNWSGNVPVAATNADLLFSGMVRLNNTNNFAAGRDFRNITFAPGAGAFTLNGNSIDLFGNIANNTAGITQTINLNMALPSIRTVDAAAGNITLGGIISGASGGLAKSGSNTLLLLGANTYGRATTISGGTLQIGNGGTTGSLGSGNVTNNAALVFNRSNALTAGNLISGTGSLTQLGAGTLTLSGANTYAGPTIISAGTLQVGSGGMTGSLGAGNVTNNSVLAFNRSNALTVSNAISGTGSLIKLDAGALTLVGENTYSGPTAISRGTLQIGNGGRSGSLGYGNVTNNAVLTFNRSDAVTVSNAISGTGALTKLSTNTLILLGANTYSGATTISGGTLQIGNGGTSGSLGSGSVANNAALVFNRSDAVTVSNLISGAGALTKLGTNTLTLSGANTRSGATTISGGTLQIGDGGTSGSLGTGRVTNNSVLVFNRSDVITAGNAVSGAGALIKLNTNTLMLTGANTYSGPTIISAGTLQIGNGGTSGSLGTGNVTNNSVLAFNRSNALTVSNAISGTGSLIKLGSSTLTLSGSNTYSGATTISAGTLQVGSGGTSGSLGTGNITNNATLSFNRSNALTVSNAISGTGALTKLGANTLILLGENSYSGATTISAGTLQVGNGGNSGSLGGGNIINNAALTFNRSDAVALSNLISGTGALIKLGTNTLTLSGANTRSGATTISGGTLQIGNGGTTGSLGTGNVTNNAALVFNRSDAIAAGNLISGSGSLTKSGAGILTLSGANTFTGPTLIKEGVLSITRTNALPGWNTSGRYSVFSGAALAVGNAVTDSNITNILRTGNFAADSSIGFDTSAGNRSYGNAISNTANGALGLVKVGTNTLTLSGNNTYSGSTTINGGVLQVGNGGSTGMLGSGKITNNAALVFNRSDAITVDNLIVGTGSLTKSGAGTLTLNGTNTYSGATTVLSGKLILNGSLQGPLTISFGAFLGGAGMVSGNSTIRGTHTLGNSPGVQSFAGNLTYAGGSSEVIWELAKNTMMQESTAVFDQIIVNGDLEFTDPTALKLSPSVSGGTVDWSNPFWNSNRSWVIFDVSGTTHSVTNLSIAMENWVDTDGGLLSDERAGATFSLSQEGSDVVLNYVIPEPMVSGLLGVSGIFMLIVRRISAWGR